MSPCRANKIGVCTTGKSYGCTQILTRWIHCNSDMTGYFCPTILLIPQLHLTQNRCKTYLRALPNLVCSICRSCICNYYIAHRGIPPRGEAHHWGIVGTKQSLAFWLERVQET